MYSCVVGISSKTNERRITTLRSWYQILDNLNPKLVIRGEWCYNLRFGIGIYKAYLLGGLRLPLNAFARELLTRLGLEVCQFNLNAWRLVVSMQVLWRKCLKGIVLSLWTSSSFATNPQRLTSPLAFINSQPGAKIVD